MACDDDYDERRRLADENERRWKAERESEKTRQLNEARRRRDEDTQRRLLGVPSAPRGSGSPDRESPEPTECVSPLMPALEFPEHKQALLRNLQAAAGILSFAVVANWAARVERLDIGQPEAALAELGAINDDYLQATGRPALPLAQMSPPIPLTYEVDAIGLEIDCLIGLVSTALYST